MPDRTKSESFITPSNVPTAPNKEVRVRVTVFSATFNIISTISCWSVYWWRELEYPEKTTDLSSHNVVSSTSHLSRIQTHNVSDNSSKCNHHN